MLKYLPLNTNSPILALNTVIYRKQRGLNSVHLSRGDIRLLWSKSLPSERRSRSTAMSPQTIPRVVPILVNHKCNFTMNRQKCFGSEKTELYSVCDSREGATKVLNVSVPLTGDCSVSCWTVSARTHSHTRIQSAAGGGSHHIQPISSDLCFRPESHQRLSNEPKSSWWNKTTFWRHANNMCVS